MSRIMFNIMICCLLAAGLSSCIYDEYQVVDDRNPQALYVAFRLTAAVVPESAATSRSSEPDNAGDGAWGNDYSSSEPIEFEEKILKDKFHVAFYDSGNNSYVGCLDDILCTELTQSGSGGIYTFHGELKLEDIGMTVEELRQKKVKMMVVANIPDIPDVLLKRGLSDSGLGSLIYEYIGQEGDFPAVPMWGVSSPDLSAIAPGKTLNLGTVNLLRVMAKVEVCVNRADPTLAPVNVKSVTVNRVNVSGYGLPGNWNGIGKTSDLKFSETLRIPDDATPVSRVFAKADNQGAVIFYMPECGNSPGAEEIVLTVTYTVDSEERQGIIRLCPYANGSPSNGNELWDVVRNHHYRYEIASIGVLKFKVSVHEWTIVEKNIDM